MKLIRYEMSESGLGPLTLDRPDKLNALSKQLVEELTQGLISASQQRQLRVLLLRSSTNKAFCVGADLKERLSMNEEQVLETLDSLQTLTSTLAALPFPTVAVLEGAAFGGGLELALACDLRVASPSSTMGLTETRLAIIPGAGGTQRLSRLVGAAKAMEWILSARHLQGAEAAQFGLVNACVEEPMAWARDFAQACLDAGPLALLAAKSAIQSGLTLPLPEALLVEREHYLKVLHTQDRLEGLKAFAEKRPPQYQGK